MFSNRTSADSTSTLNYSTTVPSNYSIDNDNNKSEELWQSSYTRKITFSYGFFFIIISNLILQINFNPTLFFGFIIFRSL